jgi:hypothetical protein
MCAWNQKGKCRHGSDCHFAHNVYELRSDGITDPKVGMDLQSKMLKDRNQKKKVRSEASTTSGTASPVRSDGSGGNIVENYQRNMPDLQQNVPGLPDNAWNCLMPALNDMDSISLHSSIRVTDYDLRPRDRSNAAITNGAASPIRRNGSTRTSFQPNMADLQNNVSNLSRDCWQGCSPQDNAPWNFVDLAQAVGDVDVMGWSPNIRSPDYDAKSGHPSNESTASGACSPKSSGSDGSGEPVVEAFRLNIAELTQHIVGVPCQQWQGPPPQAIQQPIWDSSYLPHAIGNNDVMNQSTQSVNVEACRNEYYEWLLEDE